MRLRSSAWFESARADHCAGGVGLVAGKQKGVLTPEEFVAAGDLLVDKCPSWSWEAGDPAKVARTPVTLLLAPLSAA